MTNFSGIGFVGVVALVAGMASASADEVYCPPNPPINDTVDDVIVDGLCLLTGVTVLGDIKVVEGGNVWLKGGTTVDGSVKAKGAKKIRLSPGTIVHGKFEAKDTVGSISISGGFGNENTIGGKIKIEKSQGSIRIVRTTVGGKLEVKKNHDVILIRDSTFNQDVKIEKNDSLVEFGISISTGNFVDGSVKINKNSGGVTVMYNVITRDLKCGKNADPLIILHNTVDGKAKGQCKVP